MRFITVLCGLSLFVVFLLTFQKIITFDQPLSSPTIWRHGATARRAAQDARGGGARGGGGRRRRARARRHRRAWAQRPPTPAPSQPSDLLRSTTLRGKTYIQRLRGLGGVLKGPPPLRTKWTRRVLHPVLIRTRRVLKGRRTMRCLRSSATKTAVAASASEKKSCTTPPSACPPLRARAAQRAAPAPRRAGGGACGRGRAGAYAKAAGSTSR